MHRISNAITFITALFLCGCIAVPLHNEGIVDPALQKIALAYEETVARAYADPGKEWQSGWFGNMWIHHKDREAKQAGLCYEWKYLVHAGVADTVNNVGWQIRGIAVRENTPNEHHAVLVYDPTKIDEQHLLVANQGQSAYVLDAWRQGKADIYPLSTWLGFPPDDNSNPRIFTISEKINK